MPLDEPVAVEAAPLVGLYADTIYDLVVSVDDEGRIWLDRTPKDILAEIGQKPERTRARRLRRRLAHRAGGLARHPRVYAFLGDAGDGKRKYIHYGRVVARAD